MVAWNWKANGSGVTNTDGSITSTVSASTESGFSIVSWTGVGTAANTIGHGLGVPPKFIITKTRTATLSFDWNSYHVGLDATAPEDYFIALNTTAARGFYTAADCWNRTKPTSTVFSVNSDASAGSSGDEMIAYCFAEVEGYSKFGSYTGNGSTDGTFVYTGFRPAFVLVKVTNISDHWMIIDDERSPDNPNELRIQPSISSAESTNSAFHCDLLSNGRRTEHALLL